MFGGNIQLSPLHITAENWRLDSRKIGISGLNLFNPPDFQLNSLSYTAFLTFRIPAGNRLPGSGAALSSHRKRLQTSSVESPIAILPVHLLGYGENRTDHVHHDRTVYVLLTLTVFLLVSRFCSCMLLSVS